MNITKGQKVDITKGHQLSSIAIGLNWTTAQANLDINASAFLLNTAGVCTQDEDMIFYNQQSSRQHAVTHSDQSPPDREMIQITPSLVPSDISKIAITLTIHEEGDHHHSFQHVQQVNCRIYDPVTNEELITFAFGEGLSSETAIVVGEVYVHNGEWKFNAISSGFNGGLSALVQNFGLSVDDDVSTPDLIPEVTPPVTVAPVSLMKIELKKKESINIQKSPTITATLEWETKKDLDLYCFYVTQANQVGKVYYRNLGSTHETPYITLDGDALTHGKETIQIHRPDALKYVLFAAYSAVSNGTGSFKSMKVRAVVDNNQGQVITSPLHEKNNYAYWVAIAHIDFTANDATSISHVEQYSGRGVEASPWLYEDGTFKMDAGPEEFKDNEDYK